MGADKLAQGAPAAIVGLNDGYVVIGHDDGTTGTDAYTKTATITFFLVKFWHFRQFTVSRLTLASISAICL